MARTRASLRHSLIESILAHKDYDVVTIADITRRSGIRRATFYSHYADKDELLRDMIREACGILIGYLTVAGTGPITMDQAADALTRLLDDLSEHEAIAHFLNADYSIPDPIPDMIEQLSSFYLSQPLPGIADRELCAYYVSGLVIGLLLYRLQDGTMHSAAYLAREFIRFLDIKKYKVIVIE
ncbi:TetR/AcrR family transcriptional regulator [Cohnella lubricantis]|uniref:TetR/AcrR family transcriptional regulator n=1 Tax=Cohnella lubricantis TaxID=2163172 RepID=UPI001FDA33EF|nr:TetR/AcrR family transcriptional regulator [Cohnella lubricantis]MBP2118040.1 AcrR family transcriptional regulator [Cohnella lubricantis]